MWDKSKEDLRTVIDGHENQVIIDRVLVKLNEFIIKQSGDI